MVQDILPPEPSPEEIMFAQAVEEIRQGQFAKAKDLLTSLLRTDQNNATYWVWMSAAMETQKERLYCLQMAYKADPQNAAARRGLVMMGALNPDDSIAPFPMNHPRPWESKLKLADEQPKLTGIKQFTGNPVFRLSAVLALGMVVIVAAVIGLGALLRNPAAQEIVFGGTPRPTVTPYAATAVPGAQATLAPLANLLTSGTYTPTPVYAATPHAGVALDSYRGAERAYKNGQWDLVIDMMAQVATSQPGSVDAIYFIAEAYRLSGKYEEALDYYQKAIEVNANFAPIYLGRARTNIILSPKKNALPDLDAAINLDKNYAEAYMERGLYFMRKNQLKSAQLDLEQAANLNPGSPVLQINLARILMRLDENKAALEAAKKAKELDIVNLEAYLVLGMAYRANGQIDEAVTELETYTKYSPNSADAFMVLGAAYYNRGDYDTALKNLQQAIKLDAKSSEAYYWTGQTYMMLKEYQKALDSFHRAFAYNTSSFEAGQAVSQAYMAMKEPRNAYASLLKVEALADTDKKKAILYASRARSLEEINEVGAAYNDWRRLLDLPAEAVSAELRAEAESRLAVLRTSTPLPLAATASPTPPATATRFPTATFTSPPATRTPKVSPTPPTPTSTP